MLRVITGQFEWLQLGYLTFNQLIQDLSTKHQSLRRCWRRCYFFYEKLLLELLGGLICKLMLLQLTELGIKPVRVSREKFQIFLSVICQLRDVDFQLSPHYSIHFLNIHLKQFFFFSRLFLDLGNYSCRFDLCYVCDCFRDRGHSNGDGRGYNLHITSFQLYLDINLSLLLSKMLSNHQLLDSYVWHGSEQRHQHLIDHRQILYDVLRQILDLCILARNFSQPRNL
ncbi:MAG: hypothetical protein EZS28_001292 [Streblomastix strix]|uniref:Uncharacterized protein n=1 Tax=Streblomastix strix TaxID=222440 RepID=A0A5J4X8Q3_9EUKA|nr:MAG: hypothetical protein EZS28_001292 [Streblomastix strix]